MTADDIMATFRKQAEQGISSVVIHGVSREMLGELRRKKRLLGMVSKGGSITSAFMLLNQCENPFIEHFDEILSVCRKRDIVLSLGNTARSGCIHDKKDRMHSPRSGRMSGSQMQPVQPEFRLSSKGLADTSGVIALLRW